MEERLEVRVGSDNAIAAETPAPSLGSTRPSDGSANASARLNVAGGGIGASVSRGGSGCVFDPRRIRTVGSRDDDPPIRRRRLIVEFEVDREDQLAPRRSFVCLATRSVQALSGRLSAWAAPPLNQSTA